jgi:4-diphosphocytidyl-2-C-methyl-D-erythritol kinase
LTIAVPARAKLNLDLEVLRRADDGFHELKTTFQSIDLHDLIEIEPARETTFATSGLAINNKQNSVLNAHEALEKHVKRNLPARIHLHKRIPPGSGMGGASSDAAATLWALKMIYALEVDLKPIAEELGSDVPFFLRGGRAKAEGRGERLTRLGDEPAWFAIAWPDIELATGDVYSKWDEVKGDGLNQLKRAAEHVEPRIKDFAQRLGAGWQMTGSGSAFFKKTETQQLAKQATKGLSCWTAVARSVAAWG